jgi:hypothetical protein
MRHVYTKLNYTLVIEGGKVFLKQVFKNIVTLFPFQIWKLICKALGGMMEFE